MDTEHLDLLVIGGPQELLAPGSALKIKQVTFSFEGLSGALQYIRLVDTVIVLPEKSIFASMPRIDHFEKFYSTGTRIRIPTPASSSEIENLSEPLLTETTSIPPIFVRLGLASFPLIDQDKEEESISSQVSSSLSLINKSTKKNAQRDFIKRAASEFFLEVMEACSVLVNGGGEVYMLFPRTKAEYTTDIKEVVKKIAPGIAMDWRQSWRERDNSEWSWLLHGVESDLYFSIDEGRFCELIDCGYHILDALPTADLIFIFLYSGSKYYLDDGVIDRSGARRVMVFRWGEGSFVLAPDGALPNIIKRLAKNKIADVVPQVTPQLSDGTIPSATDALPSPPKCKKKPDRPPPYSSKAQDEFVKLWHGQRTFLGKSPYVRNFFPRFKEKLLELGIKNEDDVKRIKDVARKNGKLKPWNRRKSSGK